MQKPPAPRAPEDPHPARGGRRRTQGRSTMRWVTRQRAVLSCMQVRRVLQRYLDGQLDEVTAKRVERHLEACRRCGLEAATYAEIKAALARRDGLDPGAVERLTAFVGRLRHDAASPLQQPNTGEVEP